LPGLPASPKAATISKGISKTYEALDDVGHQLRVAARHLEIVEVICSRDRVAVARIMSRISYVSSKFDRKLSVNVVDGRTRIGWSTRRTLGTTSNALRPRGPGGRRAGGRRANHGFGLDDAVLIKDNHVARAGGIRSAVNACAPAWAIL